MRSSMRQTKRGKMKLVRDRIPEIIEADGKWCLARTVSGFDEHMHMLKEKILEEAQEFIEDPCAEEAADMLEVVRAFCYLNNISWEDVSASADKKQTDRGGFVHGIVLQEVGE